MPDQPIVHKEPAVQSNPFAKHMPDHLNAGAVAIESERAIAEAQGKLVIAKRFPRDQARAYAAIIDACKRPGLAEEACYSFPRGGQTVSGPSIRLAEMLAANWGNIDYGIRELSRKEGVSEMEAYCWDLETNTMSSQKFTVRHIRDTRGGGVKLTDERDIYELTANMGGRRLRARILAIIPADLVQAAVDGCSKTLAGGGELPIADRIRAMVTAFGTLGVQPALIEKRLGHALANTTGEELGDLRKIHNSIRDGVSKVADWFGDKPAGSDDEQMPGDPAATRPEPPARKPRGSKAVTSEVVVEKEQVPIKPGDTVETNAGRGTAIQTPPSGLGPNATAALQGVEEAIAAGVGESEAPKASGAGAMPRLTLKDGEKFTGTVTVVDSGAFFIGISGVPTPSVKAEVAGDYKGVVFHKAGGVLVDNKPALPPMWQKGSVLKVTLTGFLNRKMVNPETKLPYPDGKLQTYVESAVAVAPQEEMMEG